MHVRSVTCAGAGPRRSAASGAWAQASHPDIGGVTALALPHPSRDKTRHVRDGTGTPLDAVGAHAARLDGGRGCLDRDRRGVGGDAGRSGVGRRGRPHSPSVPFPGPTGIPPGPCQPPGWRDGRALRCLRTAPAGRRRLGSCHRYLLGPSPGTGVQGLRGTSRRRPGRRRGRRRHIRAIGRFRLGPPGRPVRRCIPGRGGSAVPDQPGPGAVPPRGPGPWRPDLRRR